MSSTDIQDKSGDAIEHVDTSPGMPISGDEDETVRPPLSPDEFRSVLQQIDALGLTWTADLPPLLRSKDSKAQEAFPAQELSEVQHKYPTFPNELGNVISYALTGSDVMRSMIGNAEDAEQKAQIARELIIGQRADFSAEFFFKYAIKVPYFVDLDWEVVVKAFERNVRVTPPIPYALLSLVVRRTMSPRFLIGADAEGGERETLTVAVNVRLIEKLIDSLTGAKSALKEAGRLAERLTKRTIEPEKIP